jgi:hypothetical protein
MIKKAGIAAGVFTVSMLTVAGMAFAQTATPTETPTPTTASTVTPTPTTTVPGGAPSTGRAR